MSTKPTIPAYVGTDPKKQRVLYGGLPSSGPHSTDWISDDSDFMNDEAGRVVGNITPDLSPSHFAKDVIQQADEQNYQSRIKRAKPSKTYGGGPIAK